MDSLSIKSLNSIDIGANRGIYTYALVDKARHIYSFDPLQECCEYIDNFDSSSVSVFNFALSDTNSSLELFIPIIGSRTVYTRASLDRPEGGYISRNISVRKLDDFPISDIGFIKIDVEGAELSVLKGAANKLQEYLPNMLIEIDASRHTKSSFDEVFGYLFNLGYLAYVCENGRLMKLEHPSANSTQYTNFIFIHHSKT
jgi:FkbM family methyltransferase